MTNETKRQIRSGGALSRAKAAAYLSISTRLLDDLLTAGDIPKIKLGRKTLIRVCDLDTYLAGLLPEEVTRDDV